MAARHELAHHVGARHGRQSDACRGGAASGGQRSLREGAGGGMSGDPPRGGRAFAGLRVARDHGAGQGMRQSRRDAVLGGAVVVQIFMQPRPLLRAPRWSSPRWSQTRRPGVCRNRRRRRHTSAASCVPAQLRRRPATLWGPFGNPERHDSRLARFGRKSARAVGHIGHVIVPAEIVSCSPRTLEQTTAFHPLLYHFVLVVPCAGRSPIEWL